MRRTGADEVEDEVPSRYLSAVQRRAGSCVGCRTRCPTLAAGAAATYSSHETRKQKYPKKLEAEGQEASGTQALREGLEKGLVQLRGR